MKVIFAAMNTTKAVVEIRPEKFQARVGFEPGMKFLNAKFERKVFHL